MGFTTKQSYLLAGKESVYGTAVTANKDMGLVQNFTPTDKNNLITSFNLGSRTPASIVAGKYEAAVDGEIQVNNGRIFEYIFGGVTHTQTSSDWKHAFTIASETPSFTTEMGIVGTSSYVWDWAGCKIANATVSIALNGILNVKFTGFAKNPTTGSTSQSYTPTGLAVLPFTTASVAVGAAGSETTLGEVQSFDLTINENAEAVFGLGSRLTQEAVAKNLTLDFTFVMAFQNMTEYTRFLGGGSTPATTDVTAFSLVFDANNGVTLGSGRREFYIQLSSVKYEETNNKMTVGETIYSEFRGSATGLGSNGCFYVDNISNTNW